MKTGYVKQIWWMLSAATMFEVPLCSVHVTSEINMASVDWNGSCSKGKSRAM